MQRLCDGTNHVLYLVRQSRLSMEFYEPCNFALPGPLYLHVIQLYKTNQQNTAGNTKFYYVRYQYIIIRLLYYYYEVTYLEQ